MTLALAFPPTSRQLCTAIPAFWRVWVGQYLGARPQLSKRLWQVFAKQATAEQLYLLRQADTCWTAPAAEAFVTVLTPAAMLALTERLSPADGRRRREKEVVQLEETILKLTDKNGAWR